MYKFSSSHCGSGKFPDPIREVDLYFSTTILTRSVTSGTWHLSNDELWEEEKQGRGEKRKRERKGLTRKRKRKRKRERQRERQSESERERKRERESSSRRAPQGSSSCSLLSSSSSSPSFPASTPSASAWCFVQILSRYLEIIMMSLSSSTLACGGIAKATMQGRDKCQNLPLFFFWAEKFLLIRVEFMSRLYFVSSFLLLLAL